MKFFLYCLCGVTGVITDLIVYFISLRLGFFYMYANSLGYLSGTIISFILNRKITFGVSDRVLLRLAIFLCIAIFGFSMPGTASSPGAQPVALPAVGPGSLGAGGGPSAVASASAVANVNINSGSSGGGIGGGSGTVNNSVEELIQNSQKVPQPELGNSTEDV